jgi:hypothetical protein
LDCALTSADFSNRLLRDPEQSRDRNRRCDMVHLSHDDYHHRHRPDALGMLVRRVLGAACLLAVPAVWIASLGALPEAKLLGMALALVLMGLGGLCLFARR